MYSSAQDAQEAMCFSIAPKRMLEACLDSENHTPKQRPEKQASSLSLVHHLILWMPLRIPGISETRIPLTMVGHENQNAFS